MLKDAQKWMRENKVHAWMILNIGGRQDRTASLFLQKPVESRHAIIVPRSGRATIVVRSAEPVKGAVRVKRVKKKEKFFAVLRREVAKLARRPTIAVNTSKNIFKNLDYSKDFLLHSEFLALRRALKARLVPADEINMLARSVKDSKELAMHRKACRETLKIIDILKKSLRGKSELELACLAELEMRKRGLTPAFGTIVAFGKNTRNVHAVPSNRKAKRGDLIMIDIGAAVNSRCADITRTFAYGKASSAQKRAYLAVKAAQLAAVEKISEGVSGVAVDSAANEILKARGYEKFIKHGAGHPLGVTVHDIGPSFSQSYPSAKLRLKAGMLMTVEPGVYLKGWGIRIEDDIVVTKRGARWMTTSAGELEIVK